MNVQPDISVYDSEDKLTLAVEVKNKPGTDTDWASKMRRNMLVHGLLPHAQYLLIALPDRFYLWTGNQLPELEKPPAYEINPVPLFRAYFEDADVHLENLSEGGFELLVLSWLNELIQTGELPDVGEQETKWLVESGLLEAIKQGHVVAEAAA